MKDIYFHIEYYDNEGRRIFSVSYPAILVEGDICFDKYKISQEYAEEVHSTDKNTFINGKENYRVKVYEKFWKQDKRFLRV